MNALRRQPGSYVRKSLLATLGVLLAAMLLMSGARAQEGGCVLSEEMATTFAERFDAIFDGPSVEIADEIFAPGFVAHLPLAPELDREGWKNYVVSFYMGVPDLTEEMNQVIVSDDRVVVHVTYTGTHDGPLLGIPATGKSMTMEGIGIFSFDENCLATENWAVLDVVGVLAQIGAFPPAAASADEAQANPLPAPTGPYQVGVEWRHWVDESRDETFDESGTSKREMMVQFLYPAESTAEGTPADYPANAEEVLPSFASLMTLVGLELRLPVSDFADFKSHAIPNAALADDEERYPVLIFSHGAAADVTMYSAQLEELASHGYVVAAINHAYGAGAVVFPDGREVNGNFAAGLEGHVPIWAQDQIFVMDKLEELNSNDPEGRFTNRLDLERLGVFGQSLGGATATLTCSLDARCKAGASGDGAVYGDVIEAGLDQPFLYLLSDSRMTSNPEFYANARGPYYEVAAAGFEHLDFGDFTLWPDPAPMRDAHWLGSVEGSRAVEITRAALLTFFDRYVKGQAEASMDALNAYPEITLTARNSETP